MGQVNPFYNPNPLVTHLWMVDSWNGHIFTISLLNLWFYKGIFGIYLMKEKSIREKMVGFPHHCRQLAKRIFTFSSTLGFSPHCLSQSTLAVSATMILSRVPTTIQASSVPFRSLPHRGLDLHRFWKEYFTHVKAMASILTRPLSFTSSL